MSAEFIKKGVGKSSLAKANRQERQLSYFTLSEVQEEITEAYIEAWLKRNSDSNSEFINWVKTVFRKNNFLAFFKYLRNPNPSSQLINDKILPHLERVFYADDSFSKYVIKGVSTESVPEIDSDKFNESVFKALLFNHNSIMIHDLEDVNQPFRDIVGIEKIAAIDSKDSVINRVAYTATVDLLNEDGIAVSTDGYIYMDAEMYSFYSKDYELILTVEHDLKECPADYISAKAFGNDDVVRKSIFSHTREKLEEYTFLKTIQRMTEPNGVVPIVTKLQAKESIKGNKDVNKGSNEPPIHGMMSSQQAEFKKTTAGSNSILQAGSEISVPRILKDDGSVDMDMVKNYINFFYLPVDAMKFLSERLNEMEQDIVTSILGSLNTNAQRRNELDVRLGITSASDKLRSVSLQLSKIRKSSDFKLLALKYGRDNVSVDYFYGSDFFLETQSDLYEMFKEAPNPIERKNILQRIARTKNRFNKDRASRDELMYELIPYSSDIDFKAAIDSQLVDAITFQLQTRFNYWLNLFEAQYGDVVVFWEALGDIPDSQKLTLINSLLTSIVKENTQQEAIVPQLNS